MNMSEPILRLREHIFKMKFSQILPSVFIGFTLFGERLHAQPLPPPAASTSEVIAGTEKNKFVSPFTLAAAGVSSGGSSITNTISIQEYFYTNTANLYTTNRFTFSGGTLSGQFGYAPGASYANNEYIYDFTTSLQGNFEPFSETTLSNHFNLFATSQLATGHIPAGFNQAGGTQVAGYAYHTDFSYIELAFLHFRKTDVPYIFTNYQASLSNSLNYVQRSNNIPVSFGTNANLYDGWGLVEHGYNSYSAAHYKRCCDLMAIMAMKSGQALVASNYFWQAQVIKASMTNLWDESRGLLRTCSQGTSINTHSLAANALAVLYDAADDRIKNRIEEEFVKYSGHNNGFFQYGALRTYPIGECLDASVDSDCDGTDATGSYQTGGYWPLTWGIEVIARRKPDLAEAMMKDMYSFGVQSNKFYEWWNVRADTGITAVNKGSDYYVNSSGIPSTYLLTGVFTAKEKVLLDQAGSYVVKRGLTVLGPISGDGSGITNLSTINTKVPSGDTSQGTTTYSDSVALDAVLPVANKSYAIQWVLFVDNTVAADGIKFDMQNGTASVSSIKASLVGHDNSGLIVNARVSALATSTAVATITGNAIVVVNAGVTITTAGTIKLRVAKNSNTTGTVSIRALSTVTTILQ